MKIILLGGCPGSGKTTISNYLGVKYKISTIINIDVIKQTIKMFVSDDYLNTTSHEASKVENLDIINAYLKHSRVVNKYIKELISKLKDKIIIIEGVTVNKELYDELSNDYEVLYLNIFASKNTLINHYEKKSLIRKSNWIDNFETIITIGDYLFSESDINIESKNIKKTLKEVYLYVEKFLYD